VSAACDNGSGPDDLGNVTDTTPGCTIPIPVLGGSLTVNPDGSVVISNPISGGVFTVQYRIQNTAGFSDATITVSAAGKHTP
jgi:hypothetical protein